MDQNLVGASFLTNYWVNSVIVAAIVIVGSFLAFSVYEQNKKSLTNQTIAIFFVSIILWILFAHLGDSKSLVHYSLLFNRLVYGSLFFWAYCLILLPFVFPKDTGIVKRPYRLVLLLISVILAGISVFTNKFIASVTIYDWGASNNFGQWGLLFNIYMSLSILPIFSYIWIYRKSDETSRRQLKFFFLGLALFLVGVVIIYLLINPMVGDERYYKYGNYSAIFLVAFTSYAILRHHLFNIRVILTELAILIINGISAIQVASSKTPLEAFLRLVFLVLIAYGSYLLLQSVRREIKFREELQQLSEQLAQANAHLKELDAMKTEFVSLASHELLTPVSAIEGYLSMLLDEKMAKIEDPKAIRYMDRVYSSAKRLARLVTDMLNVSRIEEGRLLVEKKEIDLSKLINETIDEVKFKAEENKQKIVFENPDGWQTFGDPDKLKEVVVNLIGNSIKYSKNPGTISIKVEKVPTEWVAEKWQKVEAEIKARPLDDQEAIKSAVDEHFHALVGAQQLLISVQDQGIGIPKEELPRLFKKFHRVGDFTTAESQGTGLGLYISRALVELHHGRIWAESEGPSHGSTFTFSLPIIDSKDELLKMEAQVPQTKEQLKPLARPVKQAEEL